MTERHGFARIGETDIPEINTKARLYRHVKTGARLLSLENDDENKVFGVSFRTPPKDATGVAHILEHSVLCGSKKYPVKEPFVELLKGSLQTFLNAFTYPDKTCYPVASQNLKDFYNLVDVYLDAVFQPLITPLIFQQEGWHYELEKPEDPLTIKGVVYNEMKGAYSSPDRLLVEYSQHAIFPDTPYGVDSGGDPRRIPELTYEAFKAFHADHYHPSNAWFFFYGDDDPEKRLAVVGEAIRRFQALKASTEIADQPPFAEPRRVVYPYAVGAEESPKAMVTVNWLLTPTEPPERNVALHILSYILLGMPGSPLRKALIDSGLGEDLAGVGLEGELQRMYFSTGLKGIAEENAERVEALILDTLRDLAEDGISPQTVEAAVNTVEFRLRENNTGNYPRGLALMLRSLTTWLYDGDPLSLLAFEKPLEAVKRRAQPGSGYFEALIRGHFLENPHRVTVLLKPDLELEARWNAEERRRLEAIKATMSPEEVQKVIETTREIRKMQETPDPPEALAALPRLHLSDIDRRNKTIPLDLSTRAGVPFLFHDLFTNGILYLDLGFDLRALPGDLLPYVGLFGRALVEMGTETEDYVGLSQRISQKTGGIRPQVHTATLKDGETGAGWLFLRGKAMVSKADDLLEILRDVLLTVRLDHRERFRQMVLESKARMEQRVIPEGHRLVMLRLMAPFGSADWAAEKMKGVSYLAFLRDLARKVDSEWDGVHRSLEAVRTHLIGCGRMVVNVTLDGDSWASLASKMDAFLGALPEGDGGRSGWRPEVFPLHEGLVVPTQVNYVGKGFNLYRTGYRFHGSALVASHFLRTAWLWDRIRVQGGAYGAFSRLDRFSGDFAMVSYRDPHVVKTLKVFDETAAFLKNLSLNQEEITKSVIGVIGDMDRYMLPDAKGFTSMIRHLTGDDEDTRQRMREEILETSLQDLRRFGDALGEFADRGRVAVLGAASAVEEARPVCGDGFQVTRLL